MQNTQKSMWNEVSKERIQYVVLVTEMIANNEARHTDRDGVIGQRQRRA